MPDSHLLALFFTSSILLGLAPGPDNLFVLTQSVIRGTRAGLIVTLGLCTGLVGHTLLVALGVAALFQASVVAFTLLKLIGIGYLLYLAWQAFRSSSADGAGGDALPLSFRRLYVRGILMNLSNPKVSIFFLAFLPQFTDPAKGPLVLQLLALGVLFIVATLLVFGGISLLAGRAGQGVTRSPVVQRWLNRIAGTLFVGLAARLMLTER